MHVSLLSFSAAISFVFFHSYVYQVTSLFFQHTTNSVSSTYTDQHTELCQSVPVIHSKNNNQNT